MSKVKVNKEALASCGNCLRSGDCRLKARRGLKLCGYYSRKGALEK